MSKHGAGCDAARGRAGDAKDERHFLAGTNVGTEHVEAAGQVAVTIALGRDVGTGALVEDEERHPVLASHVGEEEALEAFLGADVGCAAADREVLAPDDDRATVDLGQAADVGQRLEVLELSVFVRAVAGETADLVEAPGIDQRVDPFADGQLAQFMLTVDALLATHLEGQLAAQVEFVNFGLPVGRFGHLGLHEYARST